MNGSGDDILLPDATALHGRVLPLLDDLTPGRAALMAHLLNCSECRDLALRTMLSKTSQSGHTPAEPERCRQIARASRLQGLTSWIANSYVDTVSQLLYSARVYSSLEESDEAAVSRCLLGLYLTECGLFDIGQLCLASRPEVDQQKRLWLRTYADLAAALCFANSSLPGPAHDILRHALASSPSLPSPDIVLRVHWLHARVRAALGEIEPAVRSIRLSFDRLVDNRHGAAALLAALDLLSIDHSATSAHVAHGLTRVDHPLTEDVLDLCGALPPSDLTVHVRHLLARLPSTERFHCVTLETRATLGVTPCKKDSGQ